jgi:hypothetical protein
MAENIFSLEVIRARHGDCMLLHYGTTGRPKLALIDGGPSQVFVPFLRPRLEGIRAERGLSEDEPLTIDLLMLSHIDEDHVFGLLELTDELRQARDDHNPRIVEIIDLWHNTFDDIIDNDATELTKAVTAQFGPAAVNGELPPDVLAELDETGSTDDVVDTVKIVASVGQGRDLRDPADDLGIERNVEADGRLILASAHSAPFDMGGGLVLTVAGPMLTEVTRLQREHRDFLTDHPELAQRVTASALARYADKSPFNLSSIVVLAEVGDRRILFTGDARGDKILQGLELVKIIDEGGSLHVDVLKGPHHGSSNNVNVDFFRRVTADHYVFSGDGDFGNPERATLEALAQARGDAEFLVHLTYPIGEIDVARQQDWEQLRAAELRRQVSRPATIVRPEWRDEDNSLSAFLAGNPGFGDRVVITEPGGPHVIDLTVRHGTR